MTIVAYGYGLSQGLGVSVTNVLVDDMVIDLEAQPDITIDDNSVTLTLEADDMVITLDESIDIEVD